MKTDLRRTISPANAFVVVKDDRFELRADEDLIATVWWDHIESVFAYTRVMAGEASLCLDFVIPAARKRKDRVVISEHVRDWGQLADALPRYLGNLADDWRRKATAEDTAAAPVAAVVPHFVVNPVQVWPPTGSVPTQVDAA